MNIDGLLVESKFFKETRDGLRLVGSECKKCNSKFFPKKRYCTNCLNSSELEEYILPTKGKLISYSVAHDSLMGIKTPYAFGYIKLIPDGVVIYSLLTDCEPFNEKLKIGMEMEMVIEHMVKDFYDNDIYAYKFRPIKEKGEST
jgi:uncharacterized OB-fold protein